MSTEEPSDLYILVKLAPAAFVIGGLIVFYLAPYNLLNGKVDSLWEFAAALLGVGFWVTCVAALVGTL